MVCSSDGGSSVLTEAVRATRSDYGAVPPVYPAGRLDRCREGLMILTDDGRLQARIAAPRHQTPKTYLVQVEGEPEAASLDALRSGVLLRDGPTRSEEHTSELQSLMRTSYAVFCLKKKNIIHINNIT